MATSVEAIVNQALMAAQRTKRIADIFEGSEEAIVALELYGQARDELIRQKEWAFARKVVPLTFLKGPPPNGGYNYFQPWSNIYAYPGYLFEYAYPDDCLDVRAIISPPGSMPDLDPLPGEFRIDNDPLPIVAGNPPAASGPAQKVILCNIMNAMLVYRARITDPTLWQPGFTESLVMSLGEKFAKAFGADVNRERSNAEESVATTQVTSEDRG